MRNQSRLRLTELALIFLLTLAGIWLMAYLPFSKQYAYNQMLESCGRGNWTYCRIFENKTPVDIAFIGSSRTICGIQDSLLETLLSGQVHTANLAFCRYGRPLHYVIFKDLLHHHHPSVLVLEVTEKESRFSHPDFPYIAESEDLVFPFHRQGYFRQLIIGTQSRLEFSLKKWLGQLPEFQKDPKNHLYDPHPRQGDPAVLAAKLNNPPKPDGLEKHWVYHTSKWYLKKMAELAKTEGVTLKFLFLPSYGGHGGRPSEEIFYRRFGEVLTPPDSIFQKPEYWVDGDHLNDNGAALLTCWLAGQF